MSNFIREIDELSCAHRSAEYPSSCVAHAERVSACVQKGSVPSEIRYAFFKITSTCNSDCEYCEHAFSRNKDKKELSAEELERVIGELGDLGVTACSLSGGEPLIHKHIGGAVRAMRDRGIEPILLTNGVLLPEKMPELYDAGLRYVIMSLDSFDAAHYKKARGIDFASVMRSYEYMVRFAKAHDDLIYRLTTVISAENADDVLSLLKRADSDGVGVQFTPYHNFINKENDVGVRDIEKIQKVCDSLLQAKKEGRAVCNSKEYISYFPTFFETKKRVPEGYRCECGFTAVYIWPNLDVRSCWSTTLPPVGNLKNETLSEIWRSEKYRAQRQKMLSCECEGCWLLCTAEFNIQYHRYLKTNGTENK